jgi:phosphopantothenoylcysteine decarboxylase/phosphopantothenate--cysteine ligase
MPTGAVITVMVSGSIAAYKSAELVREISRAGMKSRVVMSKAATEFISPLTLQTLSGSPVTQHLFDPQEEASIGHIRLADECDAVLVAPATADILAKAALGLADDALSAVLLATRAPVVFAPAMNVNMWHHPATQHNVQVLRSRGCIVMEPERGELACGWVGEGRFPEISAIVEEVEYALSPKDLSEFSVLVTAGPTKESFDPIRYLSNRSSGKMGYALATEARMRGAHVTLVSGPTQIVPPRGVRFVQIETADQMRAAVFESLASSERKQQLVCMAAAVSDHRPAERSEKKLKHDKTKPYSIEMVPCPDILAELGAKRRELEVQSQSRITLVGFAAESADDEEELKALSREKMARKAVDLIVGNFVSSMGKDTNRVWLMSQHGATEEVAMSDKRSVARRILDTALGVP